MENEKIYSGTYTVVALDHGLSLDELGHFEKILLERARGSAIFISEVRDVTCANRSTESSERIERLREGDWLYFKSKFWKPAFECLVGKNALAFVLLGDEFLWGDAEASCVTQESLCPVIEVLLSAFKTAKALIAPSGRYFPGGWVSELVCEGLAIAEIVDRIRKQGEPHLHGHDELSSFLSARGPDRAAILNQYFLL